jgi:hypothetical protein
MSAQGHATAADTDAAHHDHYEGIPADRAGPDEPRTPLWLPLVGISLLLVALLAFAVTRPAGKTGAELAKEASPEASAAAAPTQPTQPTQPGTAAPNPRMRNLPPHVASALAEARGSAKKAADEEQGIAPAPAGSAARPRPAPGAAPTVNPPHGMPGHVH